MRRLAWTAAIACLAALAPAQAGAGPGEPEVPPGRDPGGVAVALIDTGVNYTLPFIAERLVRNSAGRLIGRDFQDGDGQPFDMEPGADPERARRHGTSVASILLGEAPGARLVPYRFKAGDFESFAQIVKAIAAGPARIVAMPLGGYRAGDWEPFRRAAAAHPELLFVLSAGNDGRNVDERPIYPSAFGLANAIVVTSTDAFGHLPRDSNWGPETVDVSTPGERIKARDHLGTALRLSGSSYAVPRIAALAARLKAEHPDWDTAALKQAILKLAIPSPAERTPRTKHGWIANPALAAAVSD